jgi:hypothetical protein
VPVGVPRLCQQASDWAIDPLADAKIAVLSGEGNFDPSKEHIIDVKAKVYRCPKIRVLPLAPSRAKQPFQHSAPNAQSTLLIRALILLADAKLAVLLFPNAPLLAAGKLALTKLLGRPHSHPLGKMI